MPGQQCLQNAWETKRHYSKKQSLKQTSNGTNLSKWSSNLAVKAASVPPSLRKGSQLGTPLVLQKTSNSHPSVKVSLKSLHASWIVNFISFSSDRNPASQPSKYSNQNSTPPKYVNIKLWAQMTKKWCLERSRRGQIGKLYEEMFAYWWRERRSLLASVERIGYL